MPQEQVYEIEEEKSGYFSEDEEERNDRSEDEDGDLESFHMGG